MLYDKELEPIDSFEGDYYFLSNFYPCQIVYKGYIFKSSESAFQSDKDLSRQKDFELLSPGRAKRLGKQVNLRPDWEEVKDSIMEDILRIKFSKMRLREKLIATYPRKLIEGNDWFDTYWGVCNGEGKNKLGKILMKIRKEIIEELK